MKQTLTLDNPIMVDGKETCELAYDTSLITVEQFILASNKSQQVTPNTTMGMKLKETDYGLHLYLGFMAVLAANHEIMLEQLESIKGLDVVKFSNIGLLFTLGKSEGTSEESNSEEPSENTAELSIPVKQN